MLSATVGGKIVCDVSSKFKQQSIKKLFGEILDYYSNMYMTKQSNLFSDCLLIMLRDFELCPFLAPLKDCYILYNLISSESKSWSAENLSTLFQVLADFYLPSSLGCAVDESNRVIVTSSQEALLMETPEARAVLLLKKIELSKGYDKYRRERLMCGVAKPPLLLANDRQTPLSRRKQITVTDLSPSSAPFRTISTQGGNRNISIVQTASRLGIYNESDEHLIELTEREERVLSGVFEHYAHIDEATKKRVIRSLYIVDIFA